MCPVIKVGYHLLIIIILSFIWDLFLPKSSHLINRLKFCFISICAILELISQIMLLLNRMYLNHRLSHLNLELFLKRILLSPSIIKYIVTSITFFTPSGTFISGSASQTVPRIRFGFYGCTC